MTPHSRTQPTLETVAILQPCLNPGSSARMGSPLIGGCSSNDLRDATHDALNGLGSCCCARGKNLKFDAKYCFAALSPLSRKWRRATRFIHGTTKRFALSLIAATKELLTRERGGA